MSVITTGNHPKALFPGIKRWWGRKYDEHKAEYPMLFETMSSDRAYEEDVQLTGFGLAPTKSEGAGVSYDSESQGYVTRYTHVAYGLGYIVTYEEQKDGLYEVVSKRRAGALAFSMRQTKENVAANVYNRAFTAAYAFGDGKELIATDHPTNSGTQSNELTTAADLSEASLEDLVIQIGQAKNDRGLKINLRPRRLIVPVNLEFDAIRITKSVLQNDTANNAVNAMRVAGMFPDGVVVNHYLTDPDAFFIRTMIPAGLTHYEREAASFDDDNDFDTKNLKYSAYERYSFGCSDWRDIYGSPGA